MSQIHKTFCRNCGALCGLEVDVEDNRIVAMRGDQDNPVSKGYFCIKAESSMERQNGFGRLPSSLKRVDGQFIAITTETALDEIAGCLEQLIERWGPNAIGAYNGTGVVNSAGASAVARGWLSSLGSTQQYSAATVDQSPKTVSALRMGSFASGKHDMATSDVWFLSGSNPLSSHQGGWGSMTMYAPGKDIRAARARGMKLIVMDPRRTQTARLADIHIQLRPGEDVAVLSALLNIILGENLHDREFCDRYVSNLDALRGAVARYTPELAARRADVPVDVLRQAALTFANASRGATSSGTGADMGPNANLAAHLLDALNVVCGRYRRAGEQVPNVSVFSDRPSHEGVNPAWPIWDHSPRMASHPDVGWAIPNEFPVNLLADEILHPGDDRLRAMVVLGGNPLTAIPGYRTVKQAFESLELLVTLECRMSETAELSDYVISCKQPYERSDLGMMTDKNSPFPAVQYTDAVVTPPEGAIEEWEFFYEVARRMKRPFDWEFSVYGSAPTGRKMAMDLEAKPARDDILDFICQRADAPFSEIRRKPGGQIMPLAAQFVQPSDPEDPARIDLLPGEVAAELDACFAASQIPRVGQGELLLHNRRLLATLNSNFIDSPAATTKYPENPLYMHPDDMKARNISDGDIVEIRSKVGMLRAPVEADSTEKPGSVSIHHSWHAGTGDGPVGALIDRDGPREAHNFVPVMSAFPVTVSLPGKGGMAH